MFKEKPDLQILEKEYKENLLEKIEKKIEIYKEDGKNEIIEIDEELRDAVRDYVYDKFYMHNEIKIEGLKEKEKLLLYSHEGYLCLTALEGERKEPHAWSIEDKGIINKIEELISAEKEETSKE